MDVIVVGCGRVGSELGAALDAAGHAVTVLDKNAGAFRALPDDFSGRVVHGSGFDRDVLEHAGVRTADALAAVTSGDNTNILSARIAREVFRVSHVVARIYDPRRAVIYQRLGIPTVATITWTTDQIMRRLDPDARPTEWVDPGGDVCMVERVLPDHWAGRLLDEIDIPGRFRPAAVRRDARTLLALSGMVGQPGDVLYVLAGKADIDDLDKLLQTVPSRGGHH